MSRFPLGASASIRVGPARAIFTALCTHLEDHVELSRNGWSAHAKTAEAELSMTVGNETIHISLDAANASVMVQAKELVVSHLAAFCGPAAPVVEWQGSETGAGPERTFRMMTVRVSRKVTPNMQRLTLSGSDLSPFAEAMHVRLFLPADLRSPVCEPAIAADGRPQWPNDAPTPKARVYTIRRFDQQAGEVDIDFVLHGGDVPCSQAPGAGFSASAMPGMTLGMFGPVGRTVPVASRYLLAGDMTALPMIGRILRELPPESEAQCLIEIEDPADEQELASAARINVRWLLRKPHSAPSETLLKAAMSNNFHTRGEEGAILFAANTSAARQYRRHLRETLNWPPHLVLVAGFW